ncbi:Ubiquitin-conjugating enzyme subunit [Lecanora helva]
MAERILLNEYKSLSNENWVKIELKDDDMFNWNVALIVINPDSLYYGGYFKASMTFPSNYPYSPPTFRFDKPLYHPNIYPDGKLCISILHTPGDDEVAGESGGERWSPAQRVESVLISIISLLDDAECSSPANVDAGVMLRKYPEGFRQRVKDDVEKSKKDIPEGFVMPTHESTTKEPEKPMDDPDFWVNSDDDEEELGGSDTDEEDMEDFDDGLPDDEEDQKDE